MPREDSPAYSFYTRDFMSDTATMSLAERGAYITLRNHQWDQLGVPGDDLHKLGRLLGVKPIEAGQLWDAVKDLFVRGDDGLWRNPELEEQRAKQQRRHDALAENGRKGGLKKASNSASKPPSNDPGNGPSKPLAIAKQGTEQLPSLSSSSSSSSSEQEIPTSTYGGAESAPRVEPVENRSEKARATTPDTKQTPSTWKRAIAIAHAVIEQWPKNPENWYPETKTRLQEQHFDPRERSPRGGHLLNDAVDFALLQRTDRGETINHLHGLTSTPARRRA